MPTTLKDIARKTGYSVTTVSRALGGFDDVNEQTREHIIRVANESGYQPNIIARQLQSQSTQTIGIVTTDRIDRGYDDFFSVLLHGIRYATSQSGYDLLISSVMTEEDELASYQRLVGGRRVDGVILARTRLDDPRIAYLQEVGHPFVVSGRCAPSETTDFPFMDTDSQQGVYELMMHFIEYGHRRIGFISSPKHYAYTAYRVQGYRDALADAGLPYIDAYVRVGDMQHDGGKDCARSLLNTAPQITALVACNDLMAIGAMQAIKDSGLEVGKDVVVGGFDDIPAASITSPSLTTVHQPIARIGEQLTEILVRLISGEPIVQPGILVKPELIIRESSGFPLRESEGGLLR